ncbi:MAG: hypothetical protein KJ063_02740 [Anaerolineae bacterium]|nr:hypothetical protein [Anaerolineae bacterium]
MLENLTLVAVVIIIIWLGTLVFYLYTSRQHADLQNELEALEQQLDRLEKQ